MVSGNLELLGGAELSIFGEFAARFSVVGDISGYKWSKPCFFGGFREVELSSRPSFCQIKTVLVTNICCL